MWSTGSKSGTTTSPRWRDFRCLRSWSSRGAWLAAFAACAGFARQIVPRPRLRGYCDYHGQDWGFASETAIRLLTAAQGEGLAGEDAAGRVSELAEAEGLSEKHIAAVHCLVSTSDPLMLGDEGGICDGRHRIQTTIDQGVQRTILLHHLIQLVGRGLGHQRQQDRIPAGVSVKYRIRLSLPTSGNDRNCSN